MVTAIAYFQPGTRRELGAMLGCAVSRDALADLRSLGLISNGPKSPRAGPPKTYVTTPAFLSRFGFNSLQELPDRESLEKARLQALRPGDEDQTVDLFGRSFIG